MSRAKMGAYEKFPDYFYEPGNLFGSYLLGKTPRQSWDIRVELETFGLRDDCSSSPPPRDHRKLHTQSGSPLMDFVRRAVPPASLSRITRAIAAHRGLNVPQRPAPDAYAEFERLIVSRLSVEEQDVVLARLEASYERAGKHIEKRLRRHTSPVTG